MQLLEQFDLLDETWSQFSNISSFDYQVGPFLLRLLFATPSLVEKITPAFQHLCTSGQDLPDLTICLWDTSENPLPALDWGVIVCNGYRGSCIPPIFIHYFDQIGALSALHLGQKRAFYAVRKTEDLPWWVSGSPLQVILHAWLKEQGMQLTHTAAVGNQKQALLLTGKGGSGKSTTTLGCLTEGLQFLGEDYCILAPDLKVYSIYQSAKWKPYTRALFPQFERFIQNPQTAEAEKALIYLKDLFPTQMLRCLAIRGTISLTVGQKDLPVLEKQDPNSALQSLMMSTLMQLPFGSSQTVVILKQIVDKIDRYKITLGKNLRANTELIRDLLG